jgi:cytochrome P450
LRKLLAAFSQVIRMRRIPFVAALFCLGAPLARLEAQLALRVLRQRCPNLRLGQEIPEYRNNFNLRGLKALQVEF